jgi:hypothetical protein
MSSAIGYVEKEGLLFVNKKKQKNFLNPGYGLWRRQRHSVR